MQSHRKVLVTLAALALALAAGRAATEEAVPLAEMLKEAKACLADKTQCLKTLHLSVLGVDVSLPEGAGWNAAVQTIGSERRDALVRNDADGQTVTVLFPNFGSDANCLNWEVHVLIQERAVPEDRPVVSPAGWYGKAYSNVDHNVTEICKNITGGVVRAGFAGPSAPPPDSHKDELLAALEAVSRAVEKQPPARPAN